MIFMIVKQLLERSCHFERREKSYPHEQKDFSLRSK